MCPSQVSIAKASPEKVTLCSVRYGPAGDKIEQQLVRAVSQNATSSYVAKNSANMSNAIANAAET